MGYQKIIVEGNLGKDPELKHTASGKAVCSFSVAVTEGRDKDHTEWFSVETWEKTAEACARYLGKGSNVLVEGRLKTRSYEDRDGNRRYITDLKADRVDFLRGATQGNGDGAPRRENDTQGQHGGGNGNYGGGGDPPFNPDDDTIPF